MIRNGWRNFKCSSWCRNLVLLDVDVDLRGVVLDERRVVVLVEVLERELIWTWYCENLRGRVDVHPLILRLPEGFEWCDHVLQTPGAARMKSPPEE